MQVRTEGFTIELTDMTDRERQMMMIDIDSVLSRHVATVEDVLICAERMYVSAYGQVVDGGQGDGRKLASLLAERLERQLTNRLKVGGQPIN